MNCELWDGTVNGRGHPVKRVDGKLWYVRRLLWTKLHGPIPEDKTVRTTCHDRLCVCPEHLYLDRRGRLDSDRDQSGRFKDQGKHTGRSKR